MAEDRYVPRLRKLYDEKVKVELKEEFGYANPMQVPRLDKIVINMGVGEAVNDSQEADQRMLRIWPRSPAKSPSRPRRRNRSRASRFATACRSAAKVTLRRERMYEFLDRLINDRAAARAGLPWPEPEELRRPRQLRHGRQGAHRVPGDRLRQGRRDPRDGHHCLHDGKDDEEARALLRSSICRSAPAAD
jgi:hypothetical protein